MIPTDGVEYTFGPVYNKISDLWDWQRRNLFDAVEGYRMITAKTTWQSAVAPV